MSARTTRASRCGRSPGRWRPPSPPPRGRPAPRPARRTWCPAWPSPGPARTPAAPAPGSWPQSPPAATKPAGSATTAPTPPPSPAGSTCPPGAGLLPGHGLPRRPARHPGQQRRRPARRGKPDCPTLPEPLITATARLRDHATGRELYDQQIAARAPYQLKRKDGPDADGYQRLSCPASATTPG